MALSKPLESLDLIDVPVPAVRSPHNRALLAMFVPDLALVAAVATLICLFAGSRGASALFRDSDAGWHIRNGERILSTLSLQHTDPFSFSKPGAPWIAWEWLSDLATGAIHITAGLGGVAVLYGLAIATSVWMWFRLTWVTEGNFLLASLFALPMLTTTTIHWLARPHLWGWLFALGSLWWCEAWSRPDRPSPTGSRHLVAIAILSALWANVHPSFLLGPAIALLYAAGGYIRRAVWGQTAPIRHFVLAAITALTASLLNPEGWILHRHVVAYLFDARLTARIGEFQSFDFRASGALPVVIALFAGLAGGLAALALRRPERFLLSLLLSVAALRSARLLPLAALLLLPLAAGSFTETLTLARGLTPRLRKSLDGVLRYADSLRNFDRGFHGAALVPFVMAILFGAVHARAEFPSSQFPVAAAENIASLPRGARIMATDSFGGYLIYRFNGDRKVFFDGRSDFYGADFVDRYSRMLEARPGWDEEFGKWNFTHAVLPPDCALLAALEAENWRELHRDSTAVVLATPAVASAELRAEAAN